MTFKQNKGITLVSLVVTIIVLIILAAIAFSMLLGENGIIKRAEESWRVWSKAEKNELESLDQTATQIDEWISEASVPDEWKGHVKEVIDNVPIPKDFEYKEGDKDTGLVIKDKSENEFVWIPVENISDIYDSENNTGQLYDFTSTVATKRTYSSTDNREPDVVTDYDNTASNYTISGITGISNSNKFKGQLQTEFDNMIASVNKYKGFYIGRYETSLDAKGKAQSKKGQEPMTLGGVTGRWYGIYQKQKEIYSDSNHVVSGMIWGSQFDQALIFVQKAGYNVTNSRSWGNCKDSLGNAATDAGIKRTTGYSDYWKACNIYDLAGNLYEGTIEANSTNNRVYRGGSYFNSGFSDSASNRFNLIPTYTGNNQGSRMQIFIEI